MYVTDKLTKPLTEVKYLNADNVDRYRCIMRIFFDNYEKLKYWMYQEEVFDELKQDPYFADYKMEQCQQDLDALTAWKNLTADQDTRKAASLEEFSNRRFRYQMTEYSVEIERLVLRLENLFIEGASLEPTLLERIRINAERFSQMVSEPLDVVYTWWTDLNNDFIRLNQNYQDYIRDLNSVRAEEMMRTRAFLGFKDRLIEYLRNFIKGLQRNVGIIEEEIRGLPEETKEIVLNKVVQYAMSIPRMDVEMSESLIADNIHGRFQSIYDWFVPENGQENEAGKLFDATNEIIRKITRYAAQISERNALGANRKEEYKKAAAIFMACKDVRQAHKMAAMIFGLERPFHLNVKKERETDSMNTAVYEETPEEFVLKPRIRTYREKSVRSGLRDHGTEKARVREQMLRQIKEDREKAEKLIHNGRIEFFDLPVIEPRVREILLRWLSDAMEDAEYSARTDDGRRFVLDMTRAAEKCVVHCEDGNFTMPKISIVFQEDEE